MFYAVRHRPTGLYLPVYQGSTHYDFNNPTGGSPRLFTSLGAARGWLTMYCKGPIVKQFSHHYEYGTEYEGLGHDTSRARDRREFEIVRVTLNIGEPV